MLLASNLPVGTYLPVVSVYKLADGDSYAGWVVDDIFLLPGCQRGGDLRFCENEGLKRSKINEKGVNWIEN